LGEAWKFRFLDKNDKEALLKYNKVLSLFMDNVQDTELCPFGIHSIAEVGTKYKKSPGDWYGPQAISCVLKQLNKDNRPINNFSMVVCNDGNIFFDKIKKKIENKKSVYVSIPVRLGL
jgi:hypothetical protein